MGENKSKKLFRSRRSREDMSIGPRSLAGQCFSSQAGKLVQVKPPIFSSRFYLVPAYYLLLCISINQKYNNNDK